MHYYDVIFDLYLEQESVLLTEHQVISLENSGYTCILLNKEV